MNAKLTMTNGEGKVVHMVPPVGVEEGSEHPMMVGVYRNLLLNPMFHIDQEGRPSRTDILDTPVTAVNDLTFADRWYTKATAQGARQYVMNKIDNKADGTELSFKGHVVTADMPTEIKPFYQEIRASDITPVMEKYGFTFSVDLEIHNGGTSHSRPVRIQFVSSPHDKVWEAVVNTSDTGWKRVTVHVPPTPQGSVDRTSVGLKVIIGGLYSTVGDDALETWVGGTGTAGVHTVVSWMQADGDTLRMSHPQLEAGSHMTPFQYPAYDVELARCRTYYDPRPVMNRTIISGVYSTDNEYDAYVGKSNFPEGDGENPEPSSIGGDTSLSVTDARIEWILDGEYLEIVSLSLAIHGFSIAGNTDATISVNYQLLRRLKKMGLPISGFVAMGGSDGRTETGIAWYSLFGDGSDRPMQLTANPYIKISTGALMTSLGDSTTGASGTTTKMTFLARNIRIKVVRTD